VRINNRLPRQWIIFGVLTLVVIVAAIIFFTNSRHHYANHAVFRIR
jgi:uncharacterized protein YpmB